MDTYQYTCGHSTFCQTMGQNSKIASWAKSCNSLALIGFSLLLTTPRVMGNLKSSTNIWNLHWRNCENNPTNWDKYLNQVQASYRITPNLATVESPFFLVYGRDPNLPLHQLLEPMQCFLGDPDSGMLNLETHRLALAIAKETWDENRFTATQKTMVWDKPAFQVGDRVYFKNEQPGKWDLKWRPGYRIVCIEHNRHFIHIGNQATGKIWSCNITDIILEPTNRILECWYSIWQRYINHPTNLPTIQLKDTT